MAQSSQRDLVRTRRLELAGAPALAVFRVSAEAAAEAGTVLFYHGLTGSKLTNLREMRRLAEAGFLAVGIDAVGHGQRRFADFDRRFAGDRAEPVFVEVVARSVEEVPDILDHLIGLGLCDGSRIGMVGVSMGGYIAYGALLTDRRIRAAVTIVSSPVWRALPARSPHLRPEAFFPVALLTVTAGQDQVVSPEAARDFHLQLEPSYRQAPERLGSLHLPDADHLLSARAWRQVTTVAVDWFSRFLPVEPPGDLQPPG